MQHQIAQALAQGGPAGFARGDHRHAVAAQRVGDPIRVRAFARAVHAFQRDEFAPYRHGARSLPSM